MSQLTFLELQMTIGFPMEFRNETSRVQVKVRAWVTQYTVAGITKWLGCHRGNSTAVLFLYI